MKNGRTGVLIALEGGEGAGKSNALRAMAEALRKQGYEVVETREPGGTPLAEQLRSLVIDPNIEMSFDTELLLFQAARADHVAKVIRPSLERGAVVITDRYVGTTLAYQGAAQDLDPNLIKRIHSATTGDLWPDLTIIFDVDPEIGLRRSKRRLAENDDGGGRNELRDLPFHQAIRHAYLESAAGDEFSVVIDASRDQESVIQDAIAGVEQRLFEIESIHGSIRREPIAANG